MTGGETSLIRRKYMRTRQLKPGMKIDQSVEDRLGRSLVSSGAILDDYIIQSLLKLGIMNVYIRIEIDDNDLPVSSVAQKNIDRLFTDDRSKVKLSDSVRKRVSEGVQYIYNNTDSGQLASATNSIAKDLIDAIDSNDAIAIDINELKTSDEYTFKHSVDVATISMILAKQLGLSQKEIYEIGVAGLLHDIGKTKIPPEILNKPGKLDDSEFAVMKQHSVFGYKMLRDNPEFSTEIPLAVLQHHEKMNGKGYPLGAAKPQITPYAKFLSVADIYDALVTERPYKKAFSQRTAVEIMMSMTNELDMTALKSFLESMILYPVGTVVELSNGEKAKVVKNNPHYILRPVVVNITNGKVYDLGNDLSCANILIQ